MRLYSQSALRTNGHAATSTGSEALYHHSENRQIEVTDEEPWSGSQEIQFFDHKFGIVISDLSFAREFDYEFVYENLSFAHFRLSGQSIEQVSSHHAPNIVRQPGFALSNAPNGHVEKSRKLSTASWQSVAIFFCPDMIEQMLGPESAYLNRAANSFRHWQLREGRALQPFSMGMSEALKAIIKCPFTGRFRQIYLQAKAIELICLAISSASQETSSSDEFQLTQRDISRLSEARDILDAQFISPPTLADLGRKVGLNRRKLATGFRQRFDISAMQYCLTLRMALARDMLQEGHPIATVADAVGYADQTSFSRAFKKHIGQTPGYFKGD